MAYWEEIIWWPHVLVMWLRILQATQGEWVIQVTRLLLAIGTKPQSPTS